MEIAQIVPHLLQREAECEETLGHLAGQAPRQAVVANRGDCRRVGVEGRFHAIEAGRKAASEERGPARAKEIADGRRNLRERIESSLQGFGQGRNGSAADDYKVVAQSEQRTQEEARVGR